MIFPRFVFRPIEDSSYFYFTQMLKRDEPIAKQDQVGTFSVMWIIGRLLEKYAFYFCRLM